MSLLVLMDLDDTLTDRGAAFDAWAVPFLAARGRPAADLARLHELDQRGVRPREEFFARVSEELRLDLDIPTEIHAYRSATGSPPLQHGVRERLGAIRAEGGKVVVLTNGRADVQRRKLGATRMLQEVDAVVISEEVGVSKPDVRIYELAIAGAEASLRDEIWMVGDNPDTDIRGALAAGLHAAWVNPLGTAWKLGEPAPELILPTTSECLDRITGALPG